MATATKRSLTEQANDAMREIVIALVEERDVPTEKIRQAAADKGWSLARVESEVCTVRELRDKLAELDTDRLGSEFDQAREAAKVAAQAVEPANAEAERAREAARETGRKAEAAQQRFADVQRRITAAKSAQSDLVRQGCFESSGSQDATWKNFRMPA